VDRQICCLTPTTTTTTPQILEVPGVVIADRICIFFTPPCGNCNNECECEPSKTKLSCTNPTPENGWCGLTTPAPIGEICQDYWFENLWIAFWSFLIALPIIIFCLERCVRPGFRSEPKHYHKSGKGEKVFEEAGENVGKTKNLMKSMKSISADAQSSSGGTVYSGSAQPKCVIHITKIVYDEPKKCRYWMTFSLCILCLIITGIVVHALAYAWRFCVGFLGTVDDGFWNSIDLNKCPFTLFGVWFALWLMSWLCTAYYWAFDVEKEKRKEIVMPATAESRAGASWGGFGGGLFG